MRLGIAIRHEADVMRIFPQLRTRPARIFSATAPEQMPPNSTSYLPLAGIYEIDATAPR